MIGNEAETLPPRDDVPPEHTRNEELTGLFRCKRCALPYAPPKSSSSLRLTYCSFLCELGDLGFSIVGLEHMRLDRTTEAPDDAAEGRELEPVAAP